MYLIQISCIICFGGAHFRLQEKADLQVRHQNCKKHKKYGAPSSFHTSVWHIEGGCVRVIIAGSSTAALFCYVHI